MTQFSGDPITFFTSEKGLDLLDKVDSGEVDTNRTNIGAITILRIGAEEDEISPGRLESFFLGNPELIMLMETPPDVIPLRFTINRTLKTLLRNGYIEGIRSTGDTRLEQQTAIGTDRTVSREQLEVLETPERLLRRSPNGIN